MSDALFSIACTTCGSRLRVRDRAIVGQILACPKCGGMVLIQAPGDVPGAPAAVPNSSAIQAASGGVIQPRESGPASKVPFDSQQETISDSDFGDVDALLSGAVPQTNMSPAKAPPEPPRAKPKPPIHDTPPAPLPTAQPPAPGADWVSPETKRMRSYALFVGGTIMGIALAMGVGFLAVQAMSRPAEKKIAENPPPIEPKEAPDTPPEETPPEVEPKAKIEEPSEKAADPPPAPAPPEKEPEKPPLETEPPEKKLDPREIVDPLVPMPMPPANPNDPLRLDEVRRISQLLQEPTATEDPSDAMEEASEKENVKSESGKPASRVRPEAKKLDFAARSNDKFTEIQIEGQSIGEVVRLLTEFSTIPISFDPEALVCSQVDPSKPVQAKLTNCTVLEVLREIGKAYKLEPITLDEQYVLTRSTAMRVLKHPVSDLLPNEPEARTALVERLKTFIAPGTWERGDDPAKITIEGNDLVVVQNDLAHFELVLLCEKLRTARGIAPKRKLPPSLLALQPRALRAAKALDETKLKLNYNRSTQLYKILHRFGEEAGVAFTIDYRSLAATGWPYDCDAEVILEGVSLREALARLLEPMDLTFRVVDERLLEITSLAAFASRTEIELHSLGTIAPDSDLIERAKAHLGTQLFNQQEGFNTLFLDPTSKTIWAKLPQSEQARLASWLDTQRMAAQ